jgi:hypothetical protein
VSETPLRAATPPVAATERRPLVRGVARTTALMAGDALAFLIFASVGRASHSEAAGLDALGAVARTAAPFAIGWYAVAPFLGVYRRSATATPLQMLRRTGLGWLAAWPLALALRWAFTGKAPPPSFAVIALVSNALFLSVWRGLFAVVAAWRRHEATPSAPR